LAGRADQARRRVLRFSTSVIVLSLVAAGGLAAVPQTTAAAAPTTGTTVVPRHSDIGLAMKRAANYYRPLYPVGTGTKAGWSWSTYFQGVHALYREVGDYRYLTDAMSWGRSNSWSLSREAVPDALKAGQVYYDLHQVDPTASLTAMDTHMSADLANAPVTSYYWIDGLFMGLPVWTRWATRTGNSAYLDKMDALYRWTRDNGITADCPGAPPGLYDPGERLWYRDCRYIERRDPSGAKVFWARGNAWVLAAMAQVLATLPAQDQRGAPYRDMLRAMADRVRTLQGADGFWRSSLLNPGLYPQAEASSTALFAYAIGYGINAGLLDRATYVPVVARAWAGLTTVLTSSGFLTHCQSYAAEPGPAYTAPAPRVAPTPNTSGTVNDDSPPFCVGAFLLASSEMGKLTGSMSTGRPLTATDQRDSDYAFRALDGDVTTRWSAVGFPQSITVDLGLLYRASNATVVPYADRAYRYRIDTSTDGVNWVLVVDRRTTTATGSKLDNFTPGTVSLRFARLTVTGVSGVATDWIRIQEFAVDDRYQPRPNHAVGGATSATSSTAGYPPTNATDNRSETFWVSAQEPSAARPQTLTADLRAVLLINTVQVVPRPGFGPRDITVLGSTDGQNWTTLATATLPNAEGPHMMLMSPSPVRWIRLMMTGSYSVGNVQVAELDARRAPILYSKSYYHYGNPALGEVRVDTWVDEQVNCQAGAAQCSYLVRGHGQIVKKRAAARVQIDLIQLIAVYGAALIQTTTPVNSGTAQAAEHWTAWLQMYDSQSCTAPVLLWNRVTASIRWTDDTLSRVSLLGPPAESARCLQD
jgi:rhamnogalacturonyl hydrolase YesR